MLLQVFSSFDSSLRSESSVDCLEAAAAALLRDENLRKVEAAVEAVEEVEAARSLVGR